MKLLLNFIYNLFWIIGSGLCIIAGFDGICKFPISIDWLGCLTLTIGGLVMAVIHINKMEGILK